MALICPLVKSRTARPEASYTNAPAARSATNGRNSPAPLYRTRWRAARARSARSVAERSVTGVTLMLAGALLSLSGARTGLPLGGVVFLAGLASGLIATSPASGHLRGMRASSA
jgi:hypothetical protein